MASPLGTNPALYGLLKEYLHDSNGRSSPAGLRRGKFSPLPSVGGNLLPLGHD
jgi:hypothetical protein